MSRKILQVGWGLSGLTVLLAFLVWEQNLSGGFGRLSTYKIFPLLGLVAYSLMWVHYVVAALRKYYKIDKSVTKQFFEITSGVALVAILLHPGLLIIQLWRDGFGLPPQSYLENYIPAGLAWATMLGTLSLIVFLVFELRRKFGARPWWKFVRYANDAAMIAIFFHALNLGGELETGWYRMVWYMYGVALVGVLVYMHGFNTKPITQ